MTFRFSAFLAPFILFLIPTSTHADATLDLDNKNNVVANLLKGTWMRDIETSEALSLGKWYDKVTFSRDQNAIPQRVLDDYGKRYETRIIYAIGMMTLAADGREVELPYLLTAVTGNPNVVWFRERGGDPFGDTERFIVMGFRTDNEAPAGPKDRLFIGGDFNNQAMQPFVRLAK